ncbi:MAG: DNA mismatch repair protein MutS, partial [Clostridia bacterium]|nr:DNA mismatch repair protein MutS [Clostridia bacterium]
RNARTSAKRWLSEYEAKEREETGIKQLKVGYNRVFGYYIEVSNSNLPMVPYRFERKQTLTTGERFITDELKKMEEVILGAEEKALALESSLFGEIKNSLMEVVAILQTNSNAVAELDLLYSLSTTAVANGYVRPKVKDNSDDLVIKEGRHPVVEALKRKNSFVPNDTVMTKDSRTLIITGPNMAGKSTYMRQVALIVLMAHVGSFVPAREAEICLVDRIFTRVGASDNVAYGQSTFMVEMTEMANILNNATPKSLLILDEIGRGTSTIDGLSIAWAIVEHLALKLKAKTLFATHYHELSELESELPGLKNYHILIKDTDGKITFLYKIARGGANKSFGIEVATLAGVNEKITNRAKMIMSSIEESQEGKLSTKIGANISEDAVPTSQIGFFQEDSKYDEIARIINDIDLNDITPLHALTILSNLQKMTKPTGRRKK